MKKVLVVVLGIVVLAAVVGGAFYGGIKVGEARAADARAQLFQQRFGAGQRGAQVPPAHGTPQPGQGLGLGGGIMGTIKAIEGDVVVVETAEGDTQVQTFDTTLIEKYMSVGVGDLEEGERVVVSGPKNEDGSIRARSIQTMRTFRDTQTDQP